LKKNNLFAGITIGTNYIGNEPISPDNWNDVIIVDKEYFLKHKKDIEKWARENQ
jgi:hypothetical protein